MTPEEVAELIESNLPDAEVAVGHPRGVDDEDHLAATVVSPAFEDRSLLDQHELVYDALGEHMTEEIHAIELTTYTPDEYENQ